MVIESDHNDGEDNSDCDKVMALAMLMVLSLVEMMIVRRLMTMFTCLLILLSLSLCFKGSYSVGNQTVCTPCPAGEACPNTHTNQSIICSPGEYSVGSQTVCHHLVSQF